jgi:hypothetical protein
MGKLLRAALIIAGGKIIGARDRMSLFVSQIIALAVLAPICSFFSLTNFPRFMRASK